jgi:NAD(P)-dependent dehydrogenase (short-subunit alcohol dehydrogenase family)
MGRRELEQQPYMQDMLAATAARRPGTAAEIANVIAFLLSPDASYVSGIDVLVDGGMLQGLAQQ